MGQVINTHQLFNKLKECGFDEKQAEAVLDTIENIQTARLEEVATKADIESLRGDMKVLQWGVALILAVVAIPFMKSFFS